MGPRADPPATSLAFVGLIARLLSWLLCDSCGVDGLSSVKGETAPCGVMYTLGGLVTAGGGGVLGYTVGASNDSWVKEPLLLLCVWNVVGLCGNLVEPVEGEDAWPKGA